MSEMTDRGWDELAEVWRNQPVPDIQKIAAKVRVQRRRLLLSQAFEICATIVMIVVASLATTLTPDAWMRAYIYVLAGYVILQQYLMVRSAGGLWKRNVESVKDMLEQSARHNRQRIYRLRLRFLEAAVIACASIPLIWHLAKGSWDVFFAHWQLLVMAGMIAVAIAVNLLWASTRIPRFRRAMHEAESMRLALVSEQ